MPITSTVSQISPERRGPCLAHSSVEGFRPVPLRKANIGLVIVLDALLYALLEARWLSDMALTWAE